ncbi:NAD-dependent epimerase/dehydratase family protein [Streptomyces cyanogenus]|uniref:4-keto reductase homolog n=1 Tax=Streptomyces cyanogenus TaxID=80860 RepID=Q9ZGC5_STRCY|nr:NAD-dependent epimerase/dehydratase family protein [Streptomyces cyanogenus]AAD13548.1 4-keto reductase homolog [Streptomyces cyanogenus]QTE01583.1 GDP-6-deoxy-D-mannose reductase [Streptomyces cyanogenus]
MTMEIVGNGFLARNLHPYADRHPDTVAVAAGVSWASGTSDADFAREAALLADVAVRCRATGRRLLFFSTAATGMYGAMDGPGREDSHIVPCTPYGAHKFALEQQLRASGADYLILRLGHLVGPGQPAHQLIPALIRQMREGDVRVQRDAARDLIDVRDVVTVIDRLLAQGLRGEIVNVASGVAVPVGHIVDHLEERLGLRVNRAYQDAGAQHDISIDKLRSLVPETAAMGFGPFYYRQVLDAFLASEGASSGV